MRAPSSSLYKDTTFFREIQIALTLRNILSTVNLQRFAAAGVWRVLYYEAAPKEGIRLRAGGEAQMVDSWVCAAARG